MEFFLYIFQILQQIINYSYQEMFYGSLSILLFLFLHLTESRVLTDLDQYRVPKTLVFTFNHHRQADKAKDPNIKGHEHAKVYYHIITPLKSKDYVMYRFDITGFLYGIQRPIDITWIGYNYARSPEAPIKTFHFNRYKEEYNLTISQYYRKDGTLVLYFGPINRYFNGFELYYQAHTGAMENGLQRENYQIRATHLPNYLV